MDPLNSYANMKSRVTPIPTPLIIRASSAVLVGAAIAVLTTDLTPGIKFGVTAAALIITLLLAYLHPYRAEIRSFREQHNISRVPTTGQVMPLFVTWLMLMVAPFFSTAALWVTILVFVVVAGWTFLTFPHIDGSRQLAFAKTA